MLLQLVMLVAIYNVDLRNQASLKNLLKKKIFLAEIIFFVLLTTLSFLRTPLGNLFGLEIGFVTQNTFYFLLTVVPAIAFAVCYMVMLATTKNEAKAAAKAAKKAGKNKR